MGIYGEFLTTLGLEIEGIGLSRERMGEIINNLGYAYPETSHKIAVTHDASTEFNASYVRTTSGMILVSNHTPEMMDIFQRSIAGSVVMGYELVTQPLEISKLGNILYPLVTTLVNNGDFVSDRAAIHYHIGFANNLRLLQNFLKIALNVDAVMYRLGGMGRTFRGKINHSAYARPLMNSVAVNVKTMDRGKRYAQIINPLAALDAKNIAEFWSCFGINYQPGGSYSKYLPSRYCGINLAAMFSHGTVEFRHFNQSHDIFLIIAIGKLVRALTELSTVISRRDLAQLEIVPSNTEISMSDASDILGRLISLCHSYEIENLPDDFEMEAIMQTISNSHFESIPEIPVLTHVREDVNSISYERAVAGKLKFFSEVLPPHIIDIHNICYSSIFPNVTIENPSKVSAPSAQDSDEPLFNDEEEEHDDEDFEEDDD